ncbi:cobalamin biosynthesis protein [Paraglaciecola aquimarina]|uniref:Cobalamin biosynthesis protein n=1 Tax=Paraglaciecola aquimarina TaxID=1235557 RepID=A0ABU3SS81_9ALTE|nr:cobalamin biosynthesis protein [Paraglaciecola aquimarina]MDU0352879.1 cobalamin biosynthesis protein [Paraglaciecola aquimarina]
MQGFIDILVDPFWLPFWTLLSAVVIEKLLPWPDKYHPLSLYKLFAIRMASKVMPGENDAAQQKLISGSLAAVVLLFPVCVVIAVFIYLSEYPMFFQGLFLLIALRFQDIQRTSSKVAHYLARDKKILARHTLQPLLLRATDKLSPMGLVKANCECLILRFGYQFCAVVFWFLLTGGVGALIYRLLYESSQCWNIKNHRFAYFGLTVSKVMQLMQWIPNVLAGLSLVLVTVSFTSLKHLLVKKGNTEPRFYLLNISGSVLGFELGGPAYYGTKKSVVLNVEGSERWY